MIGRLPPTVIPRYSEGSTCRFAPAPRDPSEYLGITRGKIVCDPCVPRLLSRPADDPTHIDHVHLAAAVVRAVDADLHPVRAAARVGVAAPLARVSAGAVEVAERVTRAGARVVEKW